MDMHRLFWSLTSKFEIKSMVKKKMLIAPILAVALVFSLTAAVSYLPLTPKTTPQATPHVAPKNQLSTASTPAATSPPESQFSTASTPAPTTQSGPAYYMNSSAASPTQLPVPAPTSTAQPATATVTQTVYFLPVLFVIVAVVLGVVAVQVLFREKELKKELSEEE